MSWDLILSSSYFFLFAVLTPLFSLNQNQIFPFCLHSLFFVFLIYHAVIRGLFCNIQYTWKLTLKEVSYVIYEIDLRWEGILPANNKNKLLHFHEYIWRSAYQWFPFRMDLLNRRRFFLRRKVIINIISVATVACQISHELRGIEGMKFTKIHLMSFKNYRSMRRVLWIHSLPTNTLTWIHVILWIHAIYRPMWSEREERITTH